MSRSNRHPEHLRHEDQLADLTTLANIAEIFGALTIAGGAIFAVLQIREFREQRRQAVTVELVRSFNDPAFARGVSLVHQLPDGISPQELRSKGPEFEEAAFMIATRYETMALLMFREMTSFSMVEELTGGLGVVMWRKLSRWAEEMRDEMGEPKFAEWFQWLAEQLAQKGQDNRSEPAYLKFKSWRPRG
jgi:hypothetical protein